MRTPPGERRETAILIVDDDQVSIMAVERAMQRLQLPYRVHAARDGGEALDVLRGTSGAEPLAEPLIVLLDINMPRMNGHEFLDQIRADQDLRKTLVFMLTSSDAQEDVDQAYARNVAGYFVKGDMFEDMIEKIATFDMYIRNNLMPCQRNGH